MPRMWLETFDAGLKKIRDRRRRPLRRRNGKKSYDLLCCRRRLAGSYGPRDSSCSVWVH